MTGSKPVKILDATALIAFLGEMSYPEGIEALSKKYRLVVPEGVAQEIIRPPGARLFQNLVEQKSIDVVKLSGKAQARAAGMAGTSAQLHRGEREAIALLETEHPQACIVSDDKGARKRFKRLNFKWTREVLGIMEKDGMIDGGTRAEKIRLLDESGFY